MQNIMFYKVKITLTGVSRTLQSDTGTSLPLVKHP